MPHLTIMYRPSGHPMALPHHRPWLHNAAAKIPSVVGKSSKLIPRAAGPGGDSTGAVEAKCKRGNGSGVSAG